MTFKRVAPLFDYEFVGRFTRYYFFMLKLWWVSYHSRAQHVIWVWPFYREFIFRKDSSQKSLTSRKYPYTHSSPYRPSTLSLNQPLGFENYLILLKKIIYNKQFIIIIKVMFVWSFLYDKILNMKYTNLILIYCECKFFLTLTNNTLSSYI